MILKIKGGIIMAHQGWISGLVLIAAGAMGQAHPASLVGNWESPGGSILRVYACGPNVCMKILKLEPGAQATDTKNPESGLRARPLCGLEIGTEFQKKSEIEATDGKIYDPDSGRLYKGEMHVEGDVMKLRGSYGLFWRTENWKRITGRFAECAAK